MVSAAEEHVECVDEEWKSKSLWLSDNLNGIGFMEELDDRFSEEAKMLARLAPKASMEAVRAAWARGLSVTVLEDGKIVSIAPDGTRTFVKELDPL